MNKVILVGRLTRDPEVRYTQSENSKCVARFTLAVDRKYKREGEAQADFISCVAWGKSGEFAEKYFHKGIKIAISGRIQTGSYTNKDNQKVYTTDVVVEEQEFVESKAASQQSQGNAQAHGSGNNGGSPRRNTEPQYKQETFTDANGFMNIPDGLDEELPWN